MRLRGWIWMLISPLVLIVGIGMGADTGEWWLAVLGGIGTILLAIRLASIANE